MIIRAEPLTHTAFRPFGDVLYADQMQAVTINEGNTLKYADLADVHLGDEGRAQLSIYRSAPISLPFRIRRMERHPLGSQAFYPLHKRPFPVVVALPGSVPEPADIRAFLTNGRQGINLNPGVWHHFQLTLDQASDYLVVDRSGPGNNLEERRLYTEVLLQI
jgi:ureidoglycolate lyase